MRKGGYRPDVSRVTLFLLPLPFPAPPFPCPRLALPLPSPCPSSVRPQARGRPGGRVGTRRQPRRGVRAMSASVASRGKPARSAGGGGAGGGRRWLVNGSQPSGAYRSYGGIVAMVGGKAVAVLPYCRLGRLRYATPAAGARKKGHPARWRPHPSVMWLWYKCKENNSHMQ